MQPRPSAFNSPLVRQSSRVIGIGITLPAGAPDRNPHGLTCAAIIVYAKSLRQARSSHVIHVFHNESLARLPP